MTTTVALAPNPVRARWQERAEALLPTPRAVMERNAVITGLYARWYLQHRAWFKWAGMAAFASHRVGLALAPYEFIEDNGVPQARGQGGLPLEAAALDDLNLVRETNNNVFRDIGWAHLAYASADGGLAEVERGLDDLKATHGRVLDGFRALDAGRRALEAGQAAEGERLVWAGNEQLLAHEQFVTVQPAFERFDKGFDAFMTVFTALDFDADNLRIDLKTTSSFFAYISTFGARVLLETRALPDIANVEQRWYWVSKRLLPLWQQVDRADPKLADKLAVLAARADWRAAPAAG